MVWNIQLWLVLNHWWIIKLTSVHKQYRRTPKEGNCQGQSRPSPPELQNHQHLPKINTALLCPLYSSSHVERKALQRLLWMARCNPPHKGLQLKGASCILPYACTNHHMPLWLMNFSNATGLLYISTSQPSSDTTTHFWTFCSSSSVARC